ncbi:MAG: regulatory iron-sulfur-containing complex subunit RicT [Thermodesulfobacteriota bacterium]
MAHIPENDSHAESQAQGEEVHERPANQNADEAPLYAGIKFREQGQVYYFKATDYPVCPQDAVLVHTDQGLGIGRVALVRSTVPEGLEDEEIKPIYRLATEEDLEQERENTALGHEALVYCRERITAHGLDMKLVDVEVFFDRGKMLFYFTAPGRVDFRELVKDLVKAYRTRIELRQIGVRHEAQMVGGIGNCGQVCCCRRFMRQFEPVTIKMAKEQQLFLNPAKISGVCGRLLCCLSFEKEAYADFQRRCPKVGKHYETAWGRLKVLRANLMRDSLVVLDHEGEEHEILLEEWERVVAEARGGQVKTGAPAKPVAQPDSAPPATQQKTPAVQQETTGAQQETGQKADANASAPAKQEQAPGKKRSGKSRRKRRSKRRQDK